MRDKRLSVRRVWSGKMLCVQNVLKNAKKHGTAPKTAVISVKAAFSHYPTTCYMIRAVRNELYAIMVLFSARARR